MRRLRIIKIRINKKPRGKWISANDFLKSDPIKGVGIPSHFTETCEELEYFYDGLQLHFCLEPLGKKNGS
jgi:hypothetical protein